jgi:F-type H+-transporting ATPase subunit b
MSILILLADASSTGQVRQIADTFGVDWPHLISQIISFAIVCFLLQRFAYKPILGMLEERRKQIADGIAEREQIRDELVHVETRRRAVMMQAAAQASEVIQEARAAAANMRESETQKAIATAELIVVKARDAASQEHDRMLRDLKQELGGLVILATSVASKKVLTEDDQRRIAEETLNEVSRAA